MITSTVTLDYSTFTTTVPSVLRRQKNKRNIANTHITTNEYLNISQKKFLPHIQKLIDIAQNQASSSDIEEKASTIALHLANIVIEQLEQVEFAPSKIVESVEGGIAFCFVAGDKYADIECLNTGEILGVTTNRRDRPSVWEVQHNESEIARATERIREFIDEK